jgi:phosphodiesterase/alkaline phosphatase D-like protein
MSFTFAVATCARVGSNGAVFDAIRAADPLVYLQLGDLHYANIDSTDPEAYFEAFDRVLTSPGQSALYRQVPIAYVWDDHDYGPNDANATSPGRSAARHAYRTAVPHYSVPPGDAPVYQAFTIGRVRFVMTDTRSERTADTMLGAEQLAWLIDELRTSSSTHALVVWANPDPWIDAAVEGADSWGGYPAERQQIADAIADAGIRNLVMVSGDAHMVAIDDGTNSDYSTSQTGGFPVLHAAALDRPGLVKGGPYSEGAFPGSGQFGLVEVDDDGGDTIRVRLVGKRWTGEEIVSLALTLP